MVDIKCITMKGGLISEAILRGYKKVENRKWVIKPGWYALHTGSGKIEKPTRIVITQNWPAGIPIPSDSELPKAAIVGLIRIGSSTVMTEPNGWETGPILNHIIDTIRLETPIYNVKGNLGLWYAHKVISPNDLKILQSIADTQTLINWLQNYEVEEF